MISVIIAAAGSGSRMGGSIKKQYRLIENLTILERTVKAFCAFRDCGEIVVSVPSDELENTKNLLRDYDNVKLVIGGKIRQESVLNALEAVSYDYVLVHDGARCFVDQKTIENVVNGLKECDCVIPCVKPKSTIRTENETLDRSKLFEVQTPQGCKTSLLREVLRKAGEDNYIGTDEAGILEHYGYKVKLVEGSYANIKITTEEDMPVSIRTGIGYDVHKLVPGRALWLGCTKIEYEKGLLGHSDADVCSHAIADALLGAAGLRDIGYYFPDNAKETEGMPGRVILEKTLKLINAEGYSVVNIDATIVAQIPKLSPHIDEMKKNIAEALKLDVKQVGIKATTEEGLGITGTGEAMTCQAIATLKG